MLSMLSYHQITQQQKKQKISTNEFSVAIFNFPIKITKDKHLYMEKTKPML